MAATAAGRAARRRRPAPACQKGCICGSSKSFSTSATRVRFAPLYTASFLFFCRAYLGLRKRCAAGGDGTFYGEGQNRRALPFSLLFLRQRCEEKLTRRSCSSFSTPSRDIFACNFSSACEGRGDHDNNVVTHACGVGVRRAAPAASVRTTQAHSNRQKTRAAPTNGEKKRTRTRLRWVARRLDKKRPRRLVKEAARRAAGRRRTQRAAAPRQRRQRRHVSAAGAQRRVLKLSACFPSPSAVSVQLR
jgi:hypothetical protein